MSLSRSGFRRGGSDAGRSHIEYRYRLDCPAGGPSIMETRGPVLGTVLAIRCQVSD